MKPPGPRPIPLLGHLPAFRRDILGLLSRSVRDHGDFVRFKLGTRDVFLVNHPDDILHVLKKNASNYDKDTRSTRFFRDICGESLLTANGDEWQCRRHLLQPAFHRKAVEGFGSIMEEEAAALVARIGRSEPFDASSAMMNTTFRVVARSLFGADLPDASVAELEGPIGLVLSETFARHGSILGLKSRAFTRAMRQLDGLVDGILAAPRREGDAPDLLALMRAGDFSESDLRNEAITFLLAGHETTANALTWLFAHLASRRGEQARCAGDPAALERALQETLRLSPPIWILERHALGADEICGYAIPAGAAVVVSPYTVHRHREFWADPDTFDPDRFLSPPQAAYLPFGLGPRTCIGRDFSLMEAKVIATALLSRFEFSAITDSPPVADPAITLRVRGGLRLKFEPRQN